MVVMLRSPSPVLAPFVRSISYWAGESSTPGRERIMPSGTVSLMVNLAEDEFRTYDGPCGAATLRVRGAALCGPSSGPTVIDTAEQRRVVDVAFTLGGAAPFFGVPLSETRDDLVELGELWGTDGTLLREQMCSAPTLGEALRVIETALFNRLTQPERDPGVAFAAGALERGAAVSAVVERVGVPHKRFAREFGERVGLSPKLFARVRRLQRVLSNTHSVGPVDWAEVANRHGYFDQAHLINDFRALTGLTPAVYLAQVGPQRNHVPFSPIVGSGRPPTVAG